MPVNRWARWLLALLVLGALACGSLQWWAMRPWPAWEAFANGYVQSDGRVIDVTADARSTSEGQAYGLFFALVANDRQRFDRILRWTEDNLAGGDLTRNLPAWLWGRFDDGASWGVRDGNPASDADLWLAYSLFEAARLWKAPEYLSRARLLLWQVKTREVAVIPDLGPVLLPAPYGFTREEGGVRLNPSYWPEFQLRYFASVDPSGPWAGVIETSDRLLRSALRNGIAPDWFELDTGNNVHPDSSSAGVSSYDAIRVYLWAGMTPGSRWLDALGGYAEVIARRGAPPEFVDPLSGAVRGAEPLGFSAAVLPYLDALNEDRLREIQRQRLRQSRQENGALGEPAHYYDQVLALFGEGWLDRRFRFDESGRLIPQWTCACMLP